MVASPSVNELTLTESEVMLRVAGVWLEGVLTVPLGATGIVIFAHGSGSSRHSPRNRYVAQVLNEGGLATLLFDLLTQREEQIDEQTAELRFNIGLLAERLVGAAKWVRARAETRGLNIGYFGASTGGGAALVAATRRSNPIGAIVSRGGRPDFAGPMVSQVRAPTLLIAGAEDEPVILINRQALEWLHSPKRLEIIRGATHLFEEPGALEQVAQLARDWFVRYLTPN
jgi:dienelactone hydrolase